MEADLEKAGVDPPLNRLDADIDNLELQWLELQWRDKVELLVNDLPRSPVASQLDGKSAQAVFQEIGFRRFRTQYLEFYEAKETLQAAVRWQQKWKPLVQAGPGIRGMIEPTMSPLAMRFALKEEAFAAALRRLRNLRAGCRF